MIRSTIFPLLVVPAFALTFHLEAAYGQLPIAEITRDEAVDFNAELMPVLRRKCLACHHSKEPEGGLVLESFSKVVAGGDSGAGIVAGDPDASTVFTRAAGIEEPLMPPEGNSVGAEPLTPHELGLLRLWIASGAAGSDAAADASMQWQPIPDTVRSIYATTFSPDGSFAVFGRGNRAIVMDLNQDMATTSLSDPSLGDGDIADVDIIQSVAVSPNGDRIATGGFRTVRLWRKEYQNVASNASPLGRAAGPIAFNNDQSQVAFVNAIGDIEVWSVAQFQLLRTLNGQGATISSVIWSSATNQIVSADTSGLLTVWNADSDQPYVQLATETRVEAITISHDGARLVTRTGAGQVQIFVIKPAAENQPPTLERTSDHVAQVDDATAILWLNQPVPTICIASTSRGALVVNPDSQEVVRTINHGAAISSLGVSPDGAILATGGQDGAVRLWKTADGSEAGKAEGNPETALQLVRWSRDLERQQGVLNRLNGATAGIEEALKKEAEALAKVTTARDEAQKKTDEAKQKVTDTQAVVTASEETIRKAEETIKATMDAIAAAMKTMEQSTVVREQLTADLTKLATDQEQAQTAVAAAEQQVAEANKALADAQAQAKKVADEITAKQQQRTLAEEAIAKATAEKDQAAKQAEEAKQLAEKTRKELEAQQAEVTKATEAAKSAEMELANRQQALAASTDAHQRAERAVPEHKAEIAAAERQLKAFETELAAARAEVNATDQAVVAIAYNNDGTAFATARLNGSLVVHRSSDGKPLHQFMTESSANLVGIGWHSDQLHAWQQRGASYVRSTKSRWVLDRVIGGLTDSPISDRVTALEFDREGLLLAVGSGVPSRSGEIMIFATDTGELLRDFDQLHSDVVLCLEFSPDEKLLASAAADKTIRLFNVQSGETERTLEGHTHHVLSLDWQSDGQIIASAGADKVVKVWEVGTGRVIRNIAGFPEELSAIDFVAATPQVVASSINGTLRLSDVNNGNTVRGFNAGGEFIYSLATSPDGQLLIAGGQSGTLRVWKIADGALVKEL